nr:immunoglobulin heavy chain junction region [Mus musculus]MBK4185657.1 immunoglobulin heavy chain junction region [Mus musculus]MBK4197254.1 immunoglobulin heavy chain junction region [Mus musculus]
CARSMIRYCFDFW